MLEPMSRTPSRMGQRYSPSRAPSYACRCARGRPGVSARVRRVRRPRRPRPGLQVRPDLADVELPVHLRPGLPGHLQGVARHRLLHARRPLRRQGRREAGRRVRRPAHARASGSSSPARRRSARRTGSTTDEEGDRKTPVVEVDGQSACIFHNRRDFALGAGCALHALALAAGPAPARDQAGRVLAAADPAYLPHRRAAGRHVVHGGHHRRVRPPRLGSGRPRPRLVLLRQHRGARRRRAACTSPTRPS